MSKINYPSIDLHCHLDGSLRAETILDIAKKENIKLPTFNIEEIKNSIIAPSDCPSLNEYLRRFDIPTMVMQSKESLERITFEVFEDAAKENVKYMEVRFCPLFHTQKGLELEEIIRSVINGMKRAEANYEIRGNIILSCLRTMPASDALKIVESGRAFLGNGVVAVDLAGPEDTRFATEYINAFKLAKNYGYRITIHAGETGIGENVLDAVTLLGAERIGHGVFIRNCVEAYKIVKEKNIILELCPTSNVQTKAVTSFDNHPLNDFFKDNLLVTINTDNRTVSNTTMTNEINLSINNINLLKEDYRKIYINSIKGSFADIGTKNWLLRLIK